MAVVGPLVGQGMSEHGGRLRTGRGQIDGGPEQAEQTGGLRRPADIHRHRAIRFVQLPPAPPQLCPKPQVYRQHPESEPGRAAQPHPAEDGLQRGEGGFREGRLRQGGLRGIESLHGEILRRNGGGGVLVRRRCIARGLPRLHIGGDGLCRPQHAHRAGSDAHRHQQAEGRQQPQGILEPGTDPPPQGEPEGGKGQNQHRRGEQNFLHVTLPLSASRRMSWSSSSSSGFREPPFTRADIISPTLPW